MATTLKIDKSREMVTIELDKNELKGPIDVQIDPGGKDYAEYNFILPSNIKTVRVLSVFSHEKFDRIFRATLTIYEINNGKEENTYNSLKSSTID